MPSKHHCIFKLRAVAVAYVVLRVDISFPPPSRDGLNLLLSAISCLLVRLTAIRQHPVFMETFAVSH